MKTGEFVCIPSAEHRKCRSLYLKESGEVFSAPGSLHTVFLPSVHLQSGVNTFTEWELVPMPAPSWSFLFPSPQISFPPSQRTNCLIPGSFASISNGSNLSFLPAVHFRFGLSLFLSALERHRGVIYSGLLYSFSVYMHSYDSKGNQLLFSPLAKIKCRAAFLVCHRFCSVALLLSLDSKNFCISSPMSSVIHWLFRHVLFIPHFFA